MKLGVAMSGGGHRASAWGVGVLAALVDVGLGSDVVSVSSVSGGSITNGVVAQNVDLHTATSEEFDRGVGGALENYASIGLFPNGPLTKRYYRTVLLMLRVALIGIVTFFGALVIALFVDGWLVRAIAAAGVGVLVVSLALLLFLVARRGTVVQSAIARTHFHGDKRSLGTALSAVDRSVNHVILTTDLEAGDQFYLAPRFLYGFREGIADPAAAGTALSEAVQASAALPGAFPPVRLLTGKFQRHWDVPNDVPRTLPDRVWLSDGGVYDNMAEQWESGIAGRIKRWQGLGDIQDPAELLIVANSSAGWDWRGFGSERWPKRELTGLLRDQGVQYDVSTARRRRSLVQTWIRHAAAGSGEQGVIVMVDRSPFIVIDAFVRSNDDRGKRAKEAAEFLGDDKTSRDRWAALARSNASVPTVLDALGVRPTVDLIEHAYISTLVGLYVIHGIGQLRDFDRERFECLCQSN